LAVAVKVTEVPVQIGPEGLAAIETVAAEPAVTVISIAAEVLGQPPEVTVLRYHVVCVSDPGIYPIVLLVPDAVANPPLALVVLLSQR
jgi:hypothetical protein